MTVYAFSRLPAFNPNTNPASVAKSATGSVYDLGDTGFLTPLNLTLVATNTVTTTLISDANGMFPDFTLVDRTQCAFKSGTQVFVLTTTTPIPGPPSTVAGPTGPAGPATTDASLLAAGTVADARLPTRLQDTALNATYAKRVGGIVNAADPQFAGGVGFARTAAENTTALQAAIDSLKGRGGTVIIPAPESPIAAAAYMQIDTITLWARINLVGASKLGARLQAKAGITSAMIKVGATDGTDPNWHWGEIRDLYLDGNKANQAAMPVRTASSASSSGYVATVTTSAAHGFTIGDVVEVAGILPDAYNGRWRVDSVPTTTTFTYGILTSAPSASTQAGSAQVMLNLINLAEAGETSLIQSVYGNGAFNSGIHQGTNGTPMRYADVSMFNHNEYGFDLWCDRPIQMDTPSGDFNGLGLIRAGGKSSAGGSGTDSSIVINNLKAEAHTVPVITLDDFDGGVILVGGSVDMSPANTGPVFRRTSKSANSKFTAMSVRITKWASGAAVLEDLSTAAQSITAAQSSGETFSFMVSNQPFQVPRIAQKRNNLTEAASITPNLQNGSICILTGTLASRTINAPAGAPLGAPNAFVMIFDIKNSSGGAMTTTWASAYITSGWTDPANGKRKTIQFWYDGTNYVQLGNPSPDL